MSEVNLGTLPLQRWLSLYPGQFGVPFSDTELGIRTDPLGAVFYVDPNHPAASDSADGTNPAQPMLTVAAALAKCVDYNNDVIVVGPNGAWTYAPVTARNTIIAEDLVVDVNGVRIVGLFPASPIGVVWQPATLNAACITVNAIDVTIEGFTFTSGTHAGADGISIVYEGTAYGDNTVIRYCMFDNTIDTAILVDFPYYADIHHNFFEACDEYGVYNAAADDPMSFSHIHDNAFYNCALGAIKLIGPSTYNHIYNNRIFNATAAAGGAATNLGIDTTGGTGNYVTGNYLSCKLPIPANGDLNDFCSGSATDIWCGNLCLDGMQVTNPT